MANKDKIRRLTWKYFIRYKLIEISIVAVIALIGYIIFINQDWINKNGELITNIIVWIFGSFAVIVVVIWIIVINWNATEERAKREVEN
jgi:hypothetical protein